MVWSFVLWWWWWRKRRRRKRRKRKRRHVDSHQLSKDAPNVAHVLIECVHHHQKIDVFHQMQHHGLNLVHSFVLVHS